MTLIFRDGDQQQIAAHGTTEKAILDQIETFRRGFPFAQLDRPCTPGDGVTVLSPQDAEPLEARYAEAVSAGRVQKVVPASGAASRMFKSLLAVHERADVIDWSQLKTMPQDQDERDFLQFVEGIQHFAFYDALREQLSQQRLCLDTALEQGQYKAILDALLMPSGLNYASLPKALLHFHHDGDQSRTPVVIHGILQTGPSFIHAFTGLGFPKDPYPAGTDAQYALTALGELDTAQQKIGATGRGRE